MKSHLFSLSRIGLVLPAAVICTLLPPFGHAGGTPTPQPMYSDAQQISSSTTPPTEAQCESAGRRCFNPQSTQAAYGLAPLYTRGLNGAGQTIAIVDSY